jgi:hypothetical protein
MHTQHTHTHKHEKGSVAGHAVPQLPVGATHPALARSVTLHHLRSPLSPLLQSSASRRHHFRVHPGVAALAAHGTQAPHVGELGLSCRKVQSLCLFVYLSVCQSFCLSVSLSVCLSVGLSILPPLPISLPLCSCLLHLEKQVRLNSKLDAPHLKEVGKPCVKGVTRVLHVCYKCVASVSQVC